VTNDSNLSNFFAPTELPTSKPGNYFPIVRGKFSNFEETLSPDPRKSSNSSDQLKFQDMIGFNWKLNFAEKLVKTSV
jgi:hypothetical protein